MATGAAALGRASLLWGEARYHQRPAEMSFRCVFLDVNSIFGWVFHGSIVSNVVLDWRKQPFESDPFWRFAKKNQATTVPLQPVARPCKAAGFTICSATSMIGTWRRRW